MPPTTQPLDFAYLPKTLRTVVTDAHLDHMGHMSMTAYASMYDEATWTFLHEVGLTTNYFQSRQTGMFAAGQHVRYLLEVRPGQRLIVYTRVLGRSNRRLHLMHLMTMTKPQQLTSTCELLLTHIDLRSRRGVDLPAELMGPFDSLYMTHHRLDWAARTCGKLAP